MPYRPDLELANLQTRKKLCHTRSIKGENGAPFLFSLASIQNERRLKGMTAMIRTASYNDNSLLKTLSREEDLACEFESLREQQDNCLISALHSRLASIEDLLGRLHHQLQEIDIESGAKSLAKKVASDDRRTDLLRRATHSILESSRRNHH